jgi:MFS family permease
MTGLAPSPVMVSMVQVASLAPMFLFSLPAGAVADIVDRRLFLIGTQAWMGTMGLLLALLTAADAINAWGLLAFTFAIGAGTAMNSPAWGATTPELVPRDDLAQAIALNGINFNLARAVGPALAGFVIAWVGTAAAFFLNAVSFLVLIAALIFWKREAPRATLPAESFLGAMRAGVRFVRATPEMLAAILRAAVFFFFTAAVWAVLPLVVRHQLGLGPEAFGLMLAAMGSGAVAAGFAMPAMRARMDRGQSVFLASLLSCVAMALLALARHWAVATLGMVLFGVAWIVGASTLQAAAQFAAPAWVRARALGIYQVALFGAMTVGAALFGWLGDAFGLPATLGLSAAGGAVCALLVRPWGLEAAPVPAPVPARGGEATGGGAAAAAEARMPLPEAPAAELLDLLGRTSGRVLEVVRYSIAPTDRARFLAVMEEVRGVRLRSGALGWRLFEDVARPERWVELWVMDSWTEHLREEHRLTERDRATLARASALQRGDAPPPEAARYLEVLPGGGG